MTDAAKNTYVEVADAEGNINVQNKDNTVHSVLLDECCNNLLQIARGKRDDDKFYFALFHFAYDFDIQEMERIIGEMSTRHRDVSNFDIIIKKLNNMYQQDLAQSIFRYRQGNVYKCLECAKELWFYIKHYNRDKYKVRTYADNFIEYCTRVVDDLDNGEEYLKKYPDELVLVLRKVGHIENHTKFWQKYTQMLMDAVDN